MHTYVFSCTVFWNIYATHTSILVPLLLFFWLNIKKEDFKIVVSLNIIIWHEYIFLLCYIYSVLMHIFFLHNPITKISWKSKPHVADGWITFYSGNLHVLYIIILIQFIRFYRFKLKKQIKKNNYTVKTSLAQLLVL